MTANRIVGLVFAGLIVLAILTAAGLYFWNQRGLSEADAIKTCRDALYINEKTGTDTVSTGRYENGNWFVYGDTIDGQPYFCGIEDAHDPTVQQWVGSIARDFIEEHSE